MPWSLRAPRKATSLPRIPVTVMRKAVTQTSITRMPCNSLKGRSCPSKLVQWTSIKSRSKRCLTTKSSAQMFLKLSWVSSQPGSSQRETQWRVPVVKRMRLEALSRLPIWVRTCPVKLKRVLSAWVMPHRRANNAMTRVANNAKYSTTETEIEISMAKRTTEMIEMAKTRCKHRGKEHTEIGARWMIEQTLRQMTIIEVIISSNNNNSIISEVTRIIIVVEAIIEASITLTTKTTRTSTTKEGDIIKVTDSTIRTTEITTKINTRPLRAKDRSTERVSPRTIN